MARASRSSGTGRGRWCEAGQACKEKKGMCVAYAADKCCMRTREDSSSRQPEARFFVRAAAQQIAAACAAGTGRQQAGKVKQREGRCAVPRQSAVYVMAYVRATGGGTGSTTREARFVVWSRDARTRRHQMPARAHARCRASRTPTNL